MCQACNTMTQQLEAAKNETAALVEKTSVLSSSREQLSLKRHLLQAFTERYQLTPEEHAVLVGDKPMDFTFFSALRRVQAIHADCKRLLRTSHQKAGVDIMDQMATLQEKAYERLYRWTQSKRAALTWVMGGCWRCLRGWLGFELHCILGLMRLIALALDTCRSMTTESVDQTRRLNMAFNALRARPVLFQYVATTSDKAAGLRACSLALHHCYPHSKPITCRYSLTELATARRNARVRGFIDALTHGGPGGNPPPIELHSHDPLRYVRCVGVDKCDNC